MTPSQRGLSLCAITAIILSAGFHARGADQDDSVPYPNGYRSWTFLHASTIPPKLPGFWKRPCESPCTAGIFYFYANAKAMTGLRTGEYPDGAIIAEELLEWRGRESGSGAEGARRMVGVMAKDSLRYGATGGWGFATYDGDSQQDQLDSAAKKACFECHIPRKNQGYVFSEYHER